MPRLVLASLVALPICAACATTSSSRPVAAECDSLVLEEPVAELLRILPRLAESSSWPGYDGALSSYIVARASTDGSACAALWSGGKLVTTERLDAAPRLLTPLFGYYFGEPEAGRTEWRDLFVASAQPEAVRSWLARHKIARAVIVPNEPVGLPFKLSARDRAYFAIHEAFHVHAQAPTWLGSSGASSWPMWDLQPERSKIRVACYEPNEAVAAVLRDERLAVSRAVLAALNGENAAVCSEVALFIKARTARYEMLAESAAVSSTLNCSSAEAIMELEEGTADFVAWDALLTLGLADRSAMQARLDARTDEPFYQMGSAQWFVIRRLAGASFADSVRRTMAARDAVSGSIFEGLRLVSNEACKK